jgi:hypothetical protein
MPAKRPRFFEKTYEGRLFAGIITANGPYVLDIASNRGTALYQSTIVNHCCPAIFRRNLVTYCASA